MAGAAAGEVYVANGSGSGAWTPGQVAHYAHMRGSGTTATTGITTAYQALAALGSNFAWAENIASGIVTTPASGYMTIPAAGVYRISANITQTFSTASSTFSFTVGVDSGGGIVTKEATVLTQSKQASTADYVQTTVDCILSLAASDKVYITLLEAAGNECIVNRADFIIERIK